MLVVNASNTAKDWQWINQHNTSGADLENASDRTSLIALQGPYARVILQSLVKSDLSMLKSFSLITEEIPGIGEVIIASTGYTGSGGYELSCRNESAVPLWEALMENGKPMNLLPIGLAARDTLRLEMGYSLYGNDIDDSTSPIEAGLGWIVKPDKGCDFIDSKIIKEQLKKGVQQKLVGFEMIERGIPRKDYLIYGSDMKKIGRVTSGTMSPSLQKGIGMGYVQNNQSIPGTEIFVLVRDKFIRAKTVNMPFLKN
jgi:aminomethyltransferase